MTFTIILEGVGFIAKLLHGGEWIEIQEEQMYHFTAAQLHHQSIDTSDKIQQCNICSCALPESWNSIQWVDLGVQYLRVNNTNLLHIPIAMLARFIVRCSSSPQLRPYSCAQCHSNIALQHASRIHANLVRVLCWLDESHPSLDLQNVYQLQCQNMKWTKSLSVGSNDLLLCRTTYFPFVLNTPAGAQRQIHISLSYEFIVTLQLSATQWIDFKHLTLLQRHLVAMFLISSYVCTDPEKRLVPTTLDFHDQMRYFQLNHANESCFYLGVPQLRTTTELLRNMITNGNSGVWRHLGVNQCVNQAMFDVMCIVPTVTINPLHFLVAVSETTATALVLKKKRKPCQPRQNKHFQCKYVCCNKDVITTSGEEVVDQQISIDTHNNINRIDTTDIDLWCPIQTVVECIITV